MDKYEKKVMELVVRLLSELQLGCRTIIKDTAKKLLEVVEDGMD